MKLNLGCGMNKVEGFVNVDKFDTCNPDMVMDLEEFPWSFENDSVDEILLNHCLEHLGQDVDVFFGIVKELYRVCEAGALIQINVPHPRHNDFINDPTHVRIITPEVMGLFSKKNCRNWAKIGSSNSPLAIYLDVDFEQRKAEVNVDQKYLDQFNAKKISQAELLDLINTSNNVAKEFKITLEVIK